MLLFLIAYQLFLLDLYKRLLLHLSSCHLYIRGLLQLPIKYINLCFYIFLYPSIPAQSSHVYIVPNSVLFKGKEGRGGKLQFPCLIRLKGMYILP
jgi:hypothetical protein